MTCASSRKLWPSGYGPRIDKHVVHERTRAIPLRIGLLEALLRGPRLTRAAEGSRVLGSDQARARNERGDDGASGGHRIAGEVERGAGEEC